MDEDDRRGREGGWKVEERKKEGGQDEENAEEEGKIHVA